MGLRRSRWPVQLASDLNPGPVGGPGAAAAANGPGLRQPPRLSRDSESASDSDDNHDHDTSRNYLDFQVAALGLEK